MHRPGGGTAAEGLAAAITAIVLTANEEPNIRRTLSRLAWLPRVIIVDSFSADATCAIALEFANVEVVQRQFDNHANQWAFGADLARTEWILTLDADYVVSHELCEELQGLRPGAAIVGYRCSFNYCVNGRRLRASLYPSRICLMRRACCDFVMDGHTQRVVSTGDVGTLRGRIDHDDRKSLKQWIIAQAAYAELEVGKRKYLTRYGKRSRLRHTLVSVLLVPVYCLLYRGLILDGRAGIFYTLQRMYAELLTTLHIEAEAQEDSSGER